MATTTTDLTAARPRRRTRRIGAAAVLAVGALLLSGCWSANQDKLVGMSNQARASKGVRAVAGNQAAMDKAQRWAQRMADTGKVEHTGGGAAVDTRGLPKFCTAGEVVGKGSTTQGIFDAWMRSAVHRDIILKAKFDRVGTGVVRKGTDVYAIQIFYEAC